MLSTKITTDLFSRLNAIYGSKWPAQFGTETAMKIALKEWATALDGYMPTDINRGIDAARTKYTDFPPTLGQFIACVKVGATRTENSAADSKCRYEYDGRQCPAMDCGRGYCWWHREHDRGVGQSVLNFLLTHGVPPPLPAWQDWIIAKRATGMSTTEAIAEYNSLQGMFLRIPMSPPSTLQSYTEELAEYRRGNEVLRQESVDYAARRRVAARIGAAVPRLEIPNLSTNRR